MKSRFLQVSVKIILAVFILVLLGLPILDLWKMFLLLGSWLALACCDLRLNKRRIYLSIAVVIFVITIRNFLPNASINEGHNIFLYTEDGSALQQGLPPEIFNDWRQAFEKQYPQEQYPDAPWRQTIPTTLYANSSDALWRTAKYSRQVDIISFKNLSEFRGGFANDNKYNFYSNDPISFARNLQVQLPFFVMYEFSKQSAGCTLHWHGTVYWQKDAESFEKIVNHNGSGRVITEEDTGKRVYALNLPAVFTDRKEWAQARNLACSPSLYELAMHLNLSPKLKVSRSVGNLLSLLGVLALIGFVTRINWKSYLIAISLTAISLIMIGVFISHYNNGHSLGPEYPTHGGGDDGLVHESYGRNMARMVMSGDLKEFLKGIEKVYWFTPGMRYFRAVEKIIFGDTNLGYTALVALLAWFVYLFVRSFAGFKWGVAGSILFLISPVGSLSFVQYVQNAKVGYAETAGFGFFMLGFYLFVRSHPRWGGQQDWFYAFTGGMCLAGSMFLRPNFAIAVSLLGLLYVFSSLRSKLFKIMIAAMVGQAFALWMPLHNYLYAHQFILISLSGATISVPLSPLTYLQAGYELLSGNCNSQHVNEVINQLSGWLWSLPHLPFARLTLILESFMVIKLVTLIVTVFIAFRSIFLREEAYFVLAWTALAAHIPMLFVAGSGKFRYAMLGWDLSAILILIVVASLIRKSYAHIDPQSTD
jgi:hypothetical protein